MLNDKIKQRVLKKANIKNGVINVADDMYDNDYNEIENCYILVNVDEQDERVWGFRVVGNRVYNFE